MSKIIDITNKLNFEEKPKIKIKDCVVTVNNDAPTAIKVIAILSDNSGNYEEVLQLYELLFNEDERRKIDALKLDIKDFSIMIYSTAQSIIDIDVGETQTPATT